MITNLSIIIATFNAEKTLNKALDSVLNQTYQNWECIIVDGASKDNTINIVKGYAQKDSRFRYISEPDKGIYDAFNKGWKMAKGEWVYYLGADDILNKHALSYIKFENLSAFDVIYGNIQLVFKNGEVINRNPIPPQNLKYKMFACHQSIFTKRMFIKDMEGFNLKYSLFADFDLMQRIYLSCGKFKYVDVDIAKFDYSGISSNYSFKSHCELYSICKTNKSNAFPLLFYCLFEIRSFIGYWHKRLLHRI